MVGVTGIGYYWRNSPWHISGCGTGVRHSKRGMRHSNQEMRYSIETGESICPAPRECGTASRDPQPPPPQRSATPRRRLEFEPPELYPCVGGCKRPHPKRQERPACLDGAFHRPWLPVDFSASLLPARSLCSSRQQQQRVRRELSEVTGITLRTYKVVLRLAV